MNANIALAEAVVDVPAIRSMGSQDAANTLDSLMRTLDGIAKRGFAARGMCLLLMEERELWKDLIDPDTKEPYRSLNSWILLAAPYSHGSCHDALRTIKELREMPIEDLLVIPRANLQRLKELSTSVRKEPAVIEAAKTLSEDQFVDLIQMDYPQQHLDKPVRPTLRVTPAVEAALDLVGTLMGIADRQGQLDGLCVDFVLEHSNEA